MSWIRVGVNAEEGLPRDRLTEQELGELRGMLAERERILGQARLLEERLQLVLMVARDRRGLQGPFRADPETGQIANGEVDDG
jgi:hypothetical protein